MRLLLVFALALMSGCGGRSPDPETSSPAPAAASEKPAPPDAPPAAASESQSEAPPEDCAYACTEIAVCWEEENEGREYTQGGSCTSGCEQATPDEQKAFFQCVVDGRSECSKMVACG